MHLRRKFTLAAAQGADLEKMAYPLQTAWFALGKRAGTTMSPQPFELCGV
jgi:hypothetical protein